MNPCKLGGVLLFLPAYSEVIEMRDRISASAHLHSKFEVHSFHDHILLRCRISLATIRLRLISFGILPRFRTVLSLFLRVINWIVDQWLPENVFSRSWWQTESDPCDRTGRIVCFFRRCHLRRRLRPRSASWQRRCRYSQPQNSLDIQG